LPVVSVADDHDLSDDEFKGPIPPHCYETLGRRNIPETLLAPEQVSEVSWRDSYAPEQLSQLFSRQQVIFTKNHINIGKSNPHISTYLEQLPDGATIYVVGVAANVCLREAVLFLCGVSKIKNFKVAVVREAIAAANIEGLPTKEECLKEFKRAGAIIVTKSDALRSMQQTLPFSPLPSPKVHPVAIKRR
jgi:nicotinamidase-related amidase